MVLAAICALSENERSNNSFSFYGEFEVFKPLSADYDNKRTGRCSAQ